MYAVQQQRNPHSGNPPKCHYSSFCVIIGSRIDKKEAAALKIKATASKARENLSAIRRLFFFCRRLAENYSIFISIFPVKSSHSIPI